MGTNYYFILDECGYVPTGHGDGTFDIDSEDPRVHIGKRSAAGLYCWDCGVSLCKEGEQFVHYSARPRHFSSLADDLAAERGKWNTACPICGKIRMDESLSEGSVGIELGFAKPRSERPLGVRSCSSFTWAQAPDAVRKVCLERPAEVLIRNEYGERFTGGEFTDMLLSNCPIEFTDSIGGWFC